jgi:hypothetical protein
MLAVMTFQDRVDKIFIGYAILSILIYRAVRKDAQRRGMNGVLWGFCSVLIPIIGVAIYLMLRQPIVSASSEPGIDITERRQE